MVGRRLGSSMKFVLFQIQLLSQNSETINPSFLRRTRVGWTNIDMENQCPLWNPPIENGDFP